MSFAGRDIITTEDLTKDDILHILDVSSRMEEIVTKEKISNLLADKMVAIIFLEPSTRTMLSFVSAANRLSAKVISVAGAKSSSAAKGESLSDTARTVEGYVDCIVIRQSQIGGAKIVADAVDVPVINAGDGSSQHPTQALLDMYTIQKETGTIEGLTIGMVGDLKFGRTVHSLSYALSHFKPTYLYCSPKELGMPEKIVSDMKDRGIDFQISNIMEDALQADIIYMTRIQRERFGDPAEYEKLKGSYVLTRDLLKKAKKDVLIMHPLPRVDEIAPEVDELPNAAYFRQAHNGVYLRMALLALVLDRA
jgi:aspartate carbamoyltransferase catalytic subunit